MSDVARMAACSRARLGNSSRATTRREWCAWLLVFTTAIPAAAFPQGAVVTIRPVPAADFPVPLTAEQQAVFAYSGGFRLDFGGAVPQHYVNVSIPLFDRQQEPRARATGRLLAAEARLRATRATVRSELESTWATFEAAQRAAAAVANMLPVIDRDIGFVEQAVRAGAFDALTRTQALRRLIESGRVADTTIRDYRAARAEWIRRSAALQRP